MELSARITGLNGGGGDGWAVFYQARAMKAAGQPVTELTIGEHDVPTDPAILNAMMRAARGGHTGYADVPGLPALRAAIAGRVAAQSGVATGPENVIVTAGGQAALLAAHATTCDPGDGALHLDPYYVTYPGTIRAVGAVPHVIATSPDNDFKPLRRDLDAAPQARSLLINTPNNPTGTVYDAATLDTIAGFAQDRDLWLISDEVYDSQVWDGAHFSPRALPGMAARTLVVGSMSKSYAMTGSRIGWIVAPAPVVEALASLALATTYGVPGFIQMAALYALNRGPDFEASIAEPFRRRRDLLAARLEGQNVLRLIPPGGAMYAMLDIRATGLSGIEFANRLLTERLIAVMPGESFGRAAAGHVRLALTRPDDELDAALTSLIRFTEEITP
ncbi:pyridoxal phosphate-dependent aminotransferase [Anianabacter salinae]|uniref:pyridoxal phosphate-dependent aminotransferase n=1 Tax=Anianabacter salinae TaxID=2851023 RepID=UPI00225E54FB|nr:aminotransferase class I/II-fold pyridoxal phosphate-dependent enzyme [Anianabacter salinae]MBV0911915.1 aminotransferase class I/II-fold pyridoxal phosphate-dependent enzyme [Anianabacter salinae]